jgi:monofunctional biosynthetic peptidoglycan transglycosylase
VLFIGFLSATVLLRYVDPPMTPVMLADYLGGQPLDHRPVPMSRVSPSVIRAVVTSEDGAFCRHAGVDLGELKAAIEESRRGRPRGASTITMQVVKNVFLWPQRSYLRKALELPLAYLFDFIVPKRRILEIYLNIAEWGPGLYGVEAAARSAFGKPAANLNDSEAALLAVSLPNPGERDAGDPSLSMERLAERLLRRMAARADLACLDVSAKR